LARGQLDLDPSAGESVSDELADAFAGLGLEFEPDLAVGQDEFWLWPENEEVFWLWAGLQTQWVVGMAGATGMNYASVESDMRMLGIPNKKRRDYYLLIKNMEQAALEEWASKR